MATAFKRVTIQDGEDREVGVSTRPFSVTLDGETVTTDIPKNNESGQNEVFTYDVKMLEALEEITKQLKITNMHLSVLTDLNIRKQDLGD